MAFYFCCVLRYVCNVFVQEGKRIMNKKAENQNTEATVGTLLPVQFWTHFRLEVYVFQLLLV